MKNLETKPDIEIGGIVLTEDCVIELQSLQHANNGNLNITASMINTAIRWIAAQVDKIDDEDIDQVVGVMDNLVRVGHTIDKLRKPIINSLP